MVLAVEADLGGGLHEELDRGLVIEDHLRVPGGLALGGFAPRDEPLGVEQGVGVALQAAGVPGEVDEEPVQDVPRERPNGRLGFRCLAKLP